MDTIINITGAGGAIPRGDWARMDEHATRYYEEIRRRSSDVASIAQNTQFSEDDIYCIKQHVFFNEYDLGEDKPRRFDANYDMAVSWQRLVDGRRLDYLVCCQPIVYRYYLDTGK